MSGRGYVTPQDVKSMAPDILRHWLEQDLLDIIRQLEWHIASTMGQS